MFAFLYGLWKVNVFTIRYCVVGYWRIAKSTWNKGKRINPLSKDSRNRKSNVKVVQKVKWKKKQRYDRQTKIPQFQIRDHVLLKIMKRIPGTNHKLQPKWFLL